MVGCHGQQLILVSEQHVTLEHPQLQQVHLHHQTVSTPLSTHNPNPATTLSANVQPLL